MLDQHENFRNGASKVTSLTANPPFRWEEIDHSLVRLRLANLADEKRIHFDNRNNLNANTFPSLILNEERIDQRIRKTYEIYCDVWQKQGRAKSADFIRTVYFRGIVPGIHARASAVASEFRMWAIRTSFSPELREAHLRSFHLKMLRFEDRWKRSMEAEAKECHHAARIAAAQAEARGTPSSPTGPDEAVGETEIATDASAKTAPVSATAKRRSDKMCFRLGVIFRAIESGRKGQDYCDFLRDRGLTTPEPWRADGCPDNYSLAYQKPGRKGNEWRRKIYREKNRNDRLRSKLQQEDPAELRRILEIADRTPRP